jgi:ribosomal protein S18 acetylase RimI-like enzyme
MPKLRPYADGDWEAVLDICLRAFAPACESVERLLGTDVDWRTYIGRYLRSLTRPGEEGRLVVAELRGAAVGVVHYQVDRDTQSGSMGVSAVHPARQGKGIASLMYRHVLDAMRAQGVKYVTADTSADSSHAPARRAYEKVGFLAVPTVHYFMRIRVSSARVPGRAPRQSRGRKGRRDGSQRA